MKKVLLYQSQIPHYRRPIFEELGKHVELTIAYTNGECCQGINYSVRKIKLHRIPKVGYWHGMDLIRLARNADILISMLAPGYLDVEHIKCFAPNIRHIRWGIGVQAGYETRFDSQNGAEAFRRIVETCDAALFYSDYPKKKYEKFGINPDKLFVANNTVAVAPIREKVEKRYILFVGTLYAQKRVDLLLDAYACAWKADATIPALMVVGDGEQKQALIALAKKLGIADRVEFMGKIEDEKVLSQLFASSIACISPDQAGLTVLKSMGYGVPFITMKNAITGGEIFNIINQQNGILMENIDALSDIILDIGRNKEKYLAYGQKAYEYYHACRTPEVMVDGFLQAIDYVSER